ncbi:SIR2 family protein [Flavobacterium cheonanense]|uniref:SIR2 family protein n=1 Tax=Flavobacterium cheonanense TaxID=706183 RepID=A0ABP7V7E7_9FLAO
MLDDKKLEKIKKILESCHINFLIGSGASTDYFQTLNMVENLLTELNSKINRDTNEFKIIDCSIKYAYFQKCIRGNLGFNNKRIAVERKEEFRNTLNNYCQLISALNTILTRRKTNIISKQINLFTTNMDLFLDYTLEKLNIEFNDGFYGRQNPVFSTSNFKKSIYQVSAHYDNKTELPTFNLFKMHGSVNWRLKKDSIYHDNQLDVLSRLNEIKVLPETLIKIEKGITIEQLKEKSNKLKVTKEIESFLMIYNELVMVNPTKEKFALTTIDYNFYEQLRMYSNSLERENSILFVTGFSFADEHIKEITQRVLRSNPTLIMYVLCYSKSDEEKIKELFPQYHNITTIHITESFCLKHQILNIFDPLAREFDSKYFLGEEKTKELKEQLDKETKTETTNREG